MDCGIIQFTMKNILSVSILSANFEHLARDIQDVEEGGADWIHIDVMDGRFVPNITMGPFIVEACRRVTNLPLDVHLMIEKPEEHILSFANAGASIITVQQETCPHLHRTLEIIHEAGCKSGVAYNPATQVDNLHLVANELDMVLIMTVNPGFSGQSFIPGMEKKVEQVARNLTQFEHPIRLQVDGGINLKTLPGILQAGANTIVAATAVFGHADGAKAGVISIKQVLDG